MFHLKCLGMDGRTGRSRLQEEAGGITSTI